MRTLDERILLAIHDHLARPWLDDVMRAVTFTGGAYVVYALTALLAAAAVLRRRTPDAIVVAVAVVTAKAVNLGLKQVFDRPRPDLWVRLVSEASPSMPSGHSAGAAAVACAAVLVAWSTRWRIPILAVAVVYAALVGFSRMYLGVHYLSDVLVGWTVGAGWVLLVWRLSARVRR